MKMLTSLAQSCLVQNFSTNAFWSCEGFDSINDDLTGLDADSDVDSGQTRDISSAN